MEEAVELSYGRLRNEWMSDKATYWRKRSMIPCRGKIFFQNAQIGTWGYPASYSVGTEVLLRGYSSLGVKLTTTAVGEFEWSQTYSFICLRGMDRNKITFTYRFSKVGLASQ